MIWIFLLLLIAFSVLAYLGGRRLAVRRSLGVRAHSRPGQHGLYALIWVGMPALVMLIAASILSTPLERQMMAAGAPDAVTQLEPFRREAFFSDARRIGDGLEAQQIWPAPYAEELPAEGRRAHRISSVLDWGGGVAALIAAILGGVFVFVRIRPDLRARNRVESWISIVLFACSAVAVLTTVGIIFSLVWDSLRFFNSVPITEFLFGTKWSPQMAIRADQIGSSGAFGAVPLFAGTFLIMRIAMMVAGPLGLFSAIYLSEYAGRRTRAVVKPLLEVLAGVPTVVYGFFAALTVGPAFRVFFNTIGGWLVGGPLDGIGQYLLLVQNQMALVAGAATFVIRVRAGGRTVEQADLPVLVEQDVAPRVLILAGAPGPEVKYLRRWATDAGFAVTTQASAGGGIALADPPVAITTESLRRFDIAVIDDRSWDGLGGGRGAVLAAVRDGLGLVLRSGGALDETGRSQWRALGFGVSGGSEMAPIALPPAPDAAAEVAMARTRRGIPAADAPADLDGDDAFLPEISRLALALGGEGTVPSVRDAGGAALSAWRASGRGRIAVFTGIDSFGLSLTGRSDLYGDWWGRIFSSVARPAAGAAPAFEGQAWVGDRVSLCSLAGEPRIERPTGAVTQLQVDAAAGTCAGFWPSEAGWHLLRTRAPDQAEQVWPFFVYPAEGLAAVRATRDRDATLMLRREAQAAGPTPGPDAPGRSWPWLAAWLIFSGGLWWLERSSRGRAVPQPH